MQNQANEQARQNNMSMDQFESDSSSSESSSASGEHKEGSKSSKDAKPSMNSGKEKQEKRKKNTQHVNPDDEGDDEDWFKMKSESSTGAESDSLDDVPAEYRGLVRDYFKALNEGGKK